MTIISGNLKLGLNSFSELSREYNMACKNQRFLVCFGNEIKCFFLYKLMSVGKNNMDTIFYFSGKCLGDNFYVRGDGTRCYFFTEGRQSLWCCIKMLIVWLMGEPKKVVKLFRRLVNRLAVCLDS